MRTLNLIIIILRGSSLHLFQFFLVLIFRERDRYVEKQQFNNHNNINIDVIHFYL